MVVNKKILMKTLQGQKEVDNRVAWTDFNTLFETKVMRDKDLAGQTAKLNFLIQTLNGMGTSCNGELHNEEM